MTAPIIPTSALKSGETDLHVTGQWLRSSSPFQFRQRKLHFCYNFWSFKKKYSHGLFQPWDLNAGCGFERV